MTTKNYRQLNNIFNAVSFTLSVHYELEKQINNGVRNTQQLQSIIDEGLKQKDITGFSFRPIISYNRTIPADDFHYYHSGEDIPFDAMILIDLGYKYKDYCADITRCYNVTNDAKYNLYMFAINIQKFVASIVRPGKTFNDIENEYIDEYIQNLYDINILKHNNYDTETKFKIKGIFQSHTIGHSVDKMVHEPMDYDAPLEENMIITIEPGIYFDDDIEAQLKKINILYDNKILKQYKKYGGARYEDMFIITEFGCNIIT